MAERRMFAKTIIDSDAFIDMPVTARLLYYDLAMRADDDGFVNSPKKIMRMIGASQDDLSILILRKFIIPFDNGIVVIKHWRIHNYIRKDMYHETKYKEEKAMLETDENNAYTLSDTSTLQYRDGIVTNPSTQDRLGKVSIGKDNIYTAEKPQRYTEEVTEIVSYLNEKAGTKYRANTEATRRHIVARLNDGFSVDDFKEVIDKKCADWMGTDYQKYLRPETLFGSKFESYLNEKKSNGYQEQYYEERDGKKYDSFGDEYL